ncbi:MAG: hypothetical protein Q8K60_00880 [Parachlamydiaceae bacterium]|nr:hypothetical protein [Parachlamydiaceae bacterium]
MKKITLLFLATFCSAESFATKITSNELLTSDNEICVGLKRNFNDDERLDIKKQKIDLNDYLDVTSLRRIGQIASEKTIEVNSLCNNVLNKNFRKKLQSDISAYNDKLLFEYSTYSEDVIQNESDDYSFLNNLDDCSLEELLNDENLN